MKLGSLFSGAGLLDLAGPRKVLAHRFPGVPNLGDITAVDWSKVEPVDIIAGGYVFLVRGGLVREALIDLDELRVIRWVTR